jgi:hypothetical protein
MKQIISIILFTISVLNGFSQKYLRDTVSFGDTLMITNPRSVKVLPDTATVYKALNCKTRSNFGFRIEVAVSNYYYSQKVEQWLGNHWGPNFNFVFVYDKVNVGFRFKPATVIPKKELVFNSDTLTKAAMLNPVKIDFYLGYSVDFKYKISIEPYLGFSRTIFQVINEDSLNKKYSIPSAKGFSSGIVINKYFRIKKYQYISVFASSGYSFVDYRKVNKNLDTGYFEWTIGVAYKIFGEKNFLKRVK